MLIDDDVPTIRQTVFILNPNLSYTFDVNQTIQIHYLKKMIAAAAHLKKNSFFIYSDGENYTDQDEEKLMNLFPNQQKVTFTVTKGEVEELDDSTVKIKIDLFCPNHELKYLSYYCYTCKKSLCSVCVQQQEHQGHNIKEKYDYLQSSRQLVDVAFRNNPTFNKEPKEMFKVLYDFSPLKMKLKNEMFKHLHDLLNKIEENMTTLIDQYNTVNKTSCDNLQDNVLLIKKYCVKGLDELKEQIDIKKIIICEDVFLTFDKKYKELYKIQNSRFETDVQKHKDLNSLLAPPLNSYLERKYNDILNFLKGQLVDNEAATFVEQINSKQINLITEKEIVSQFLPSNTQKVPRAYSALPHQINQAIQNLTKKENSSEEQKKFPQVEPSHKYSAPSVITPEFPQQDSQDVDMAAPSEIYEHEVAGVKKEEKNIEYIMTPIQNSNSIKILNVNGQLKTQPIIFPLILGATSFYQSCAHCNLDGYLYVTGGVEIKDSTASSSIVFRYDLKNNSIVRLTNMQIARHNHTMAAYQNFIFAVGGYNNNSVERYDTLTNKWTKLPSMIYEREFPILCVHNDYLYAFFGKNAKGYTETIEKLNLTNKNAMWEKVNFSNPEMINLKVYGSAVSEVEDILFFFSGVVDGKPVNTIFSYDLTKDTFESNDQKLDWSEYFSENLLYNLGSCYSQITEKTYSVISLQLTG